MKFEPISRGISIEKMGRTLETKLKIADEMFCCWTEQAT